jgi:hypothetical protein
MFVGLVLVVALIMSGVWVPMASAASDNVFSGVMYGDLCCILSFALLLAIPFRRTA